MKALIGSLTALALIATPAVAQTTNKTASTKTVVTKSGREKATTTVSTTGNTTVAKTTVTKRHKARGRHRAARCGCPSYKMKSHRSHKAPMKKSTTTDKKTATK